MDKSDEDDVSENDNEKDRDFDIKDYRDDIDSDESFEGYDDDNENAAAEGQESEAESEYAGPILPGGHRFDKKLTCIRYPGVVESVENALETLGGAASISTASTIRHRRLELRFRPDDVYCKPACGDRHPTAGFLLRVRVKKSRARQMEAEAEKSSKNQDFQGPFDLNNLDRLLGQLGKKVGSNDSEIERSSSSNIVNTTEDSEKKSNADDRRSNEESAKVPEIPEREIPYHAKSSTKPMENGGKNIFANDGVDADLSRDEDYEIPKLKVIGRVETEFRFQNLCDFQYLPIAKNLDDPSIDDCIYGSVYPSEIPSYRWLKNKVPYFLPPPAFSRMDTVQQYSLKTESETGPENVIGKTRRRRAGFSNIINFTTDEIPTAPPAGIEAARKLKFLQQSHLERMRKLFDERPIWSKNALQSVTDFTNEQLKFLLPSVAYYFVTGPWRILWVRLGYDPRNDQQARKYQTLDYRHKAMHGLESTVQCKRKITEHSLPYKSVHPGRSRTTILGGMADESDNIIADRGTNENNYIYRDGFIPPARQMFYQYCDVHVDEIQEMLAKLPNQQPGVKCHEKRGWLPSGFSDHCREIINRQVRTTLRKQMNIPEDHPTALPPKRPSRKNLRVGKLATKKSKKPRSSKKNVNDKREEPEVSDSDWTHMDSESN